MYDIADEYSVQVKQVVDEMTRGCSFSKSAVEVGLVDCR